MEDEHHGDFDPNELRQHEEFTKVKNVDKIELGRYQLETWYFSPLPPEYNNCKVSHALYICKQAINRNLSMSSFLQAPCHSYS